MTRLRLLDSLNRAVPGWAKRMAPASVKKGVRTALGGDEPPSVAPEPHFLEREHLPRTDYETVWQARYATSEGERRQYLEAHRERYFELLNTLAWYLRDREPGTRVLEVGVSEYVALYKHYFPGIRLFTLDRPLEHHGVDPDWCRQAARAEAHYALDLNAQFPSPDWGEPPLGRFDFVIFTEVIEHLVVNPVELLESLLALLAPQGLLYLTTPNFFRFESLEKFSRRENPQAVYPRRGQNWDAHHHFREYCLSELQQFVAEAGGRILTHYYSACWDGPAIRAADPSLRSNIVLVIASAAGA